MEIGVSPKQKCPFSPKLKCPLGRDKKMDELLPMSAKELSRLGVMQKLSEKRMSQKEAGAILHVSTRQIKRLLKSYRQKGAAGLVSKHRGRKGNNRLAESVKKQALNLLK